MKHLVTKKAMCLPLAICCLISFSYVSRAQTGNSGGKISGKVFAFEQKGSFSKETALFSVAKNAGINSLSSISRDVKNFTLLQLTSTENILKTRPAFLCFEVPFNSGKKKILLYQESISPNGFTLISSDGNTNNAGDIVHYKGAVSADNNSVAAFSFSANEVTGLISTSDGNFVLGKLNDNSGVHILYNDKDLVNKMPLECGTNTAIPASAGNFYRENMATATATAKCVNWYWETDYDLFTAKGSLANVNTYMQGVFNQVQTLYANDGISITLKTLYVWTTTDPYTGTSTSGYLDQFGVYRTSFDGDLASLIGTKGGGGIAWINGLCNNQNKYKMAYCGISTSYSTVPNYSWTVECITHEQGHLLGSRHTHDCAWNGNNTKIDGCGDAAGYSSGTCAVPALPAGGGTIMSYCHLTSAGINFNLGFGPQPKALIINNVNNASCLINCSTGCTNPAQPGTITGATAICAGTIQTYSVAAVSGATGYTWTLPSGWSGSSTTNSISATVGTAGGSISVTATNSCGSGTARTLAATVSAAPSQPAAITGNAAVCSGTAQTYSVAVVQGATSYTWTLPSGWNGSSSTNSINATSGTNGGAISITANNNCGSSAARTMALSITASSPAQPGTITGASTVCPGAVQSYSVSPVTGANSYNWSLPSGWSGTSTSNSITVTAGSSAGNISVTATNGCGTSSSRSIAVATGGTVPAQPGSITVTGGSATVCSGDSRTYTVSQVTGITYTWVAPAGASITSGQGNNSIVLLFSGAFPGPGILSVNAVNSCGTSVARELSISKAAISKPGVITVSGGIAKVCNGDTRTYSVPAVSGITYNWTAPAGGNITSGQGSSVINVTYTANFTANGTLKVTANNNCGTSNARNLTIVRNIPSAPGSISGPTPVCSGIVTTYSVPAVSGATGYSWTLPAGASIQGPSTNNSVNVLWGSNGGNLSVRATTNCGSSGSRSLKITVNCTGGLSGTIARVSTNAEVYPNPASDIANVKFYSKENSTYTFSLTDLAGRKMISEKHLASPGINIHKFSLAGFGKGSYLIIVEGKNSKEVLQLVVQ